MRVDVHPSEDTTYLYLRWEVVAEGGERRALARLVGPLLASIAVTHYVDPSGKAHDEATVEVPIWPHAGERNFGQARFTDHEARRSFIQHIQGRMIEAAVAYIDSDAFQGDGDVGDVEGHTIAIGAHAAS